MTKSAIVDKILEYKKQGYLFHGSPEANMKQLEPRPGTDADKSNLFNNDTAVFATSRSLMAVFFSLMDFSVLKGSGAWSVNLTETKIPTKWHKDIKTITGYIYILPSKTFTEKSGSQYKSKVAVKPVNVIPVTYNTFLELGGEIKLT